MIVSAKRSGTRRARLAVGHDFARGGQLPTVRKMRLSQDAGYRRRQQPHDVGVLYQVDFRFQPSYDLFFIWSPTQTSAAFVSRRDTARCVRRRTARR